MLPRASSQHNYYSQTLHVNNEMATVETMNNGTIFINKRLELFSN